MLLQTQNDIAKINFDLGDEPTAKTLQNPNYLNPNSNSSYNSNGSYNQANKILNIANTTNFTNNTMNSQQSKTIFGNQGYIPPKNQIQNYNYETNPLSNKRSKISNMNDYDDNDEDIQPKKLPNLLSKIK